MEKLKTLLAQNEPLIIAGPCSAETEHQVLETARQIAKNNKVKLFRAGVWKPRTRPNNFEGNGEKALPWLQSVKAETGLPTTIEVANGEHVDLALKYGVDVLWIGARTVVNPFSVQEVADALRGVDIPVMIKNPVTPDMELWVGAIERVAASGIDDIVAIHRGFTSFDKSQYRNQPKWSMPIEFRRRMPDIPMICDPSHIAGNTLLLFHVAQTALNLDMKGLMIETHINPREALSDARQQITPEELSQMLATLVYAKATTNEAGTDVLESLRQRIDKVDRQLIEILAERMEAVKKIGEFKRDNQVTVLQMGRWNEIVNNRIWLGKSLGLQEETVKKFLDLIHIESIQLQQGIINGSSREE